MTRFEQIPDGEAQRIEHIVNLTRRQLQMRYPGTQRVLRGVHAKAHGCVQAEFTVLDDLPVALRVGVFGSPGRSYSAYVRFSNAATSVLPDSTPPRDGNPAEHGSRGMAIKLLDVEGDVLGVVHGDPTQDFLMINQPVFAFANVEDYEVLSRVLVDHQDDARPFFAERLPPPGTIDLTEAQRRAMETLHIVSRIRSDTLAGNAGAFQTPPASPVDNTYFGASAFLFGEDHVMRFRVVPINPSAANPDTSDPNYLRTGLIARLRDSVAGPVVIHFEIQVREGSSLEPERDIENSSHAWPDTIPFVHVATVTIPLQEFDSPEQDERCEQLVFSPWHSLSAHRPLGGINRLRRAVYEMSAMLRHLPKEPGVL